MEWVIVGWKYFVLRRKPHMQYSHQTPDRPQPPTPHILLDSSVDFVFGLSLWILHIWRVASIKTVPMPGTDEWNCSLRSYRAHPKEMVWPTFSPVSNLLVLAEVLNHGILRASRSSNAFWEPIFIARGDHHFFFAKLNFHSSCFQTAKDAT